MRKIYFLVLWALVPALSLWGQAKHDCYWMLGYGGGGNPFIGASVMDFCGDSLEIYPIDRTMNFDRANTAMSDEDGRLLFYTNGIYVANVQNDLMLNGENLSTYGSMDNSAGAGGLTTVQGVLALPWPDMPEKYALFYGTSLYFTNPGSPRLEKGAKPFNYAIVDMQFENGLGAVYEKNLALNSVDTCETGKITAVRHANGRDWWVVVPLFNGKKILRYLFTPEGVVDYGVFELEEPLVSGGGYALFSPDGNYYAHLSFHRSDENYVTFFHFDRCTGDFEEVERYFSSESLPMGSLAISPNSRYLYFTTLYDIRQFDLWAADISASMQIVAEYDGHRETMPISGIDIPTVFYVAQLAPDGKIYIVSSNTVRAVHVIESPDLPGEACDVRQHSLMLPRLNKTLPNHPNYNLPPLAGSPCDTLQPVSAAAEPLPGSGWQLQVQPNPASGHCTVSLLPASKGSLPALSPLRLRLHSSAGQLVLEQALPNWPSTGQPYRLELRGLPPGLYFLSVQEAGKPPKTQKLVIIE